MDERNSHRHGRWTGLFKLSEECGELVVAAIDVAEHECDEVFAQALEDELADTSAACCHVEEANALDIERMRERTRRQIDTLSEEIDMSCMWPGRDLLIRRAGVLIQLVGKIAAFPDGTEHPDGCGNLVGRLEVAIADLMAANYIVVTKAELDGERIERRRGRKRALFRSWFPAPPVAGAAVAA